MSNLAKDNKAWHIGIWVAQILVALLYIMSINVHAFMTVEAAAEMGIFWIGEYPKAFSTSIGIIEIFGVIGLILPTILRIKPHVAVWAAWGLFAIQPLAIAFHVMRGEFEALPFNFIIVALIVFVIWGRTRKAVIEAK